MRPLSIVLLTASLSALAGCTTTELSRSWVVDRLRILAVKAEPAEPGPGETVHFEGLVVSPEAELELVMWIGCLGSDLDVFGCEIDATILEDLEGIDPEQMSLEELMELYEALQEAGLMGVEPFLPPSFEVPEDILDELSEEERNEGLSLFVQVTAIPEGAADQDDSELGLKRVPVSDAATPNHNPVIDHLLVEGVPVQSGTLVEVEAGQPYDLEPVLSADSIESYEFWTVDDTWEQRVEEPYFSIYIDHGAIDAANTLYPYSGFTWTAPEDPELTDATVWIVVQDRRGGMNWWSQQLRIR
jgi:hypothetical protein